VEEKSLVEPGYFGSSKDNIMILYDFVDKLDLEHMNVFAPHISQWENPRETEYDENGVCIYDASYWWDRMCSGEILKRINPFMHEMVDKYIDKMQRAIEEKFAVALHKRPPVLVRWLPGNEQSPHSDKQLNDGSPNPFPTYDINSIIYWNNDFEGGQFYYPEHDIELEIEPGMAVAHPGDIHYLHGVKPIISGTRWTTPSFYTITGLQE
jgi:hypothetical protein